MIVALFLVHPPARRRPDGADEGALTRFGASLRYIRTQPGIGVGIGVAVLIAFFGNPVTQFTVVFAEDVFHADGRVVGLLAASIGIGAVVASPALSTWEHVLNRADACRRVGGSRSTRFR